MAYDAQLSNTNANANQEQATTRDIVNRTNNKSPVDERNHQQAVPTSLAKPQKLSVVLPQSQKSLKTPTIITSANSATATAAAALTPSHLFSSFVQLNGHEVSLFTGVPGCTPTSADCLAASSNLSNINPFFCGVSSFDSTNGHTTANHNQQQQNGAQESSENSKTAAHSDDQQNSYAGQQQQAASERRHQLSKLSLDQLQAANAMILSPLTFLLSPEQESWLRFAGFQHQHQHHPLAECNQQIRSTDPLPNCNNHKQQAQDLTNHHLGNQQRRQQHISPLSAKDSSQIKPPATQTQPVTSSLTESQKFSVANPNDQIAAYPRPNQVAAASATSYLPRRQQNGYVAPESGHNQQPPASLPSLYQGDMRQNGTCLPPMVYANTPGDAGAQHSRQHLHVQDQHHPQQQMAVLVMRNAPQQSEARFVELQHSAPSAHITQSHYHPLGGHHHHHQQTIGLYNPHLHQQLYIASQQQQHHHQQDIYNLHNQPQHSSADGLTLPTNHQTFTDLRPALPGQQQQPAPNNSPTKYVNDNRTCTVLISEPSETATKIDDCDNGYASLANQQVHGLSSSSKESISNSSSSCNSSLDVSPTRHSCPELSADSRDTIDVTTTPSKPRDLAVSSTDLNQSSNLQRQSTVVLNPKPKPPASPERPSNTISSASCTQEPVKKKSKGGRKKKIISHEELITRKNRSKERNRVAAKRCRQKRKQFLDELRGRIDDLNELNAKLQKENTMLKGELETLKKHHRQELSYQDLQ